MVEKNLVIEGAKLGFTNFSGRESAYNPKGNRTFCIFLSPEDGERFEKDGWFIKWREPRTPDEERLPRLQVTVRYGDYPPRVVLISSSGMTELNEDTIQILDKAEIANVDLVVRPYNWNVGNRSGVAAYLKSMYVTLAEDELALKYANLKV